GSRALRSAGLTASARASRPRRVARAAALLCLGESRQGRFLAKCCGSAAKVHAEDEKSGEEKIAQERVAEKHPGRRRAKLRESNRERLEKPAQRFRITGIGRPRKCVRDHIENCRCRDGSGQ